MKTHRRKDIIETIESADPEIRNRTFEELLLKMDFPELVQTVATLENFRIESHNLYHRVRAALFLHAIHRYRFMGHGHMSETGLIPQRGVQAARMGNFEEALQIYHQATAENGYSEAICSAIAEVYHALAFRYLRDQVLASLRHSEGNASLFTTMTLADYTLRASTLMTSVAEREGLYPILWTRSAVRMDPSHSGWSDIFFLGMDYPEGARVVNISIDLTSEAGQGEISPPIESYCRMIAEPVIKLTSVDLTESRRLASLDDVFNIGADHLGLLKAGIVASGVVPPSLRDSGGSLQDLLTKLLGRSGGFELVTNVKGIPKGSRLAVSTSLLACIITNLMCFSGQTQTISGTISDTEKRLVASRAILGEWLGGSGGGWQDTGGIWPGVKIISGQLSRPLDPEYGISRGTLLPKYGLIPDAELGPDFEKRLVASVVLVHGGMAQNVGPILEMVTEKYLLRNQRAWHARLEGFTLFDEVVDAMLNGDMQTLGQKTTSNFERCIEPIIPWVNNSFCDEIRERFKEKFGPDFWGFLMLGGMTGGGMAFMVNPERREVMEPYLSSLLKETKRSYEKALPFVMDPVIYRFQINRTGIQTILLKDKKALMPPGYYSHHLDTNLITGDQLEETLQNEISFHMVRNGPGDQSRMKLNCNEEVGQSCQNNLFQLRDSIQGKNPEWEREAGKIKRENGFDAETHERLRQEIKSGKISIQGNRLPADTEITDVFPDDVVSVPQPESEEPDSWADLIDLGQRIINNRGVAVVTLAAGLGSRWTRGAGVVKILNPFLKIGGRHRSFAEIHIAKTIKSSSTSVGPIPLQHVFSTSFLTHEAIRDQLQRTANFGYSGPVYLSGARAIGQKLYPTERDLQFYWQQKTLAAGKSGSPGMKNDYYETILRWTRDHGEAEDYTSNVPEQRFYPPGHWYEVPNMLRNGVLARMLRDNPALEHLLIHNADTLGASLDPLHLGLHVQSAQMLTGEVIARRIEDKGGGLARVKGKLRLIEGMALPHHTSEYQLRYYSTLTTWIALDLFLTFLGLDRADILAAEHDRKAWEHVHNHLTAVEQKLPTYVTIKEVKLRWGAGQEDIFPVMQCEKLWGDITSLPGVSVQYLAVDRRRGQQLKDPDYLDSWANDGSKDFVIKQCSFT